MAEKESQHARLVSELRKQHAEEVASLKAINAKLKDDLEKAVLALQSKDVKFGTPPMPPKIV